MCMQLQIQQRNELRYPRPFGIAVPDLGMTSTLRRVGFVTDENESDGELFVRTCCDFASDRHCSREDDALVAKPLKTGKEQCSCKRKICHTGPNFRVAADLANSYSVGDADRKPL